MSGSQVNTTKDPHATPPSSFTDQPLTPLLTDKKLFAKAPRVIALFRQIQAGRNTKQGTLKEFKLIQGEYDWIKNALQQDEVLSGYVRDKIRLVEVRDCEDNS